MNLPDLQQIVRRENIRFMLLWVIRFLYRFGFVTGWTLIVSLFVARYTVLALPYLFVVNALFIMCGSAVFSFFLARLKNSVALISTIFVTGLALVMAIWLIDQSAFFFLLLLFAEAFLMYQLNFVLENFVEGLFSYLESEKKFPLLETADTVGGLTAGALIFALANIVETQKFIYLWIVSLFLMIPIFLSFPKLRVELHLNIAPAQDHFKNVLERVNGFLSHVGRYGFYRILISLVFCYWFAINLVEYQFTNAVYQNVQNIPHEGSGFEHALIHNFGSLNILFYGSILLVQSLVGGKLISKFGVIGGMLVYPTVMLLSVLAMFFNFNFLTSVLAKNNVLISGIIFKNSYLSSYYVIKEKIRYSMKELLEGFIHPVGAIAATALLVLMQHSTWSDAVPYQINYVLFVVFGLALFLVFKLRREYLRMAMVEFQTGTEDEERIVAAEIISQEGMKHGMKYLIEQLDDSKLPMTVKLKILHLLHKRECQNYVLPFLLQILQNGDSSLREEVLKIIGNFDFLAKAKNDDGVFTNHRVIETMQKMLMKEEDYKLQALIFNILSKFKHFDTVSFLLHVLKKSKNPAVLSGCLALCRSFKDVTLLHYLNKLFSHKSPLIRFQAILCAWDFPDLAKDKAAIQISTALSGKSNALKRHALNALLWSHEGAIAHFEVELSSLLSSKEAQIQFSAALCLARLGNEACMDIILSNVLHGENKFAILLRDSLDGFPKKFRKALLKKLKHKIDDAVLNLLNSFDETKDKVIKDSIDKLKHLFEVVNDGLDGHEILQVVEENLKKRYSV